MPAIATLLTVFSTSPVFGNTNDRLAEPLSQAIADSFAYPAKILLYTYIVIMLLFGVLIGFMLLSIIPADDAVTRNIISRPSPASARWRIVLKGWQRHGSVAPAASSEKTSRVSSGSSAL